MERSNHGSNPQEKKDRSKADSYIPISLTSCVGKLVERLINTRLTWNLEKRQIITPQKAGFRQNISTESQVAYIAQEIEDALQDKKAYTRGLDLPIKNIRQSVDRWSEVEDAPMFNIWPHMLPSKQTTWSSVAHRSASLQLFSG